MSLSILHHQDNSKKFEHWQCLRQRLMVDLVDLEQLSKEYWLDHWSLTILTHLQLCIWSCKLDQLSVRSLCKSRLLSKGILQQLMWKPSCFLLDWLVGCKKESHFLQYLFLIQWAFEQWLKSLLLRLVLELKLESEVQPILAHFQCFELRLLVQFHWML